MMNNRYLSPVVRSTLLLLLLCTTFLACKRTKKDKTLYGVDAVEALPPSAGKDKLKTTEQFISILHANLFQEALSANELVEITECIESIGDKDVAHEVVISKFMNTGGVKMPSEAVMRGDLDKFLEDTYKRFYVRDITESEKEFLKNFIESNPDITPELVYLAFTLSNEYQYY